MIFGFYLRFSVAATSSRCSQRCSARAAASAGQLQVLWREIEDELTPEGKLVRDADKVEMMIQCLRYELSGSRGLDDFWASMDRQDWHYPLCADLYARLREMRPGNG